VRNHRDGNHIPTLYLVIHPEFFCRCRRMFFRTRTTLGGFSEQRGDEFAGDSADHGDHGDVCCGRRISARDDRYGADDRRSGLFLPGIAGAGGIGQKRVSRNWVARRCMPRSPEPWISKSERSSLPGRLRSLVGKMGERPSATPAAEVFNRVEFDAALECAKFPAE